MSRLPALFPIVILSLLVHACSPAAAPASTSTPTVQAAASPAAPATSLPSPTAAPALSPTPEPATGHTEPDPVELPRPQYTLTATLNYAAHHLAVDQRIRYTNRSPEALPDLALMVEPRSYSGVFQLDALEWGPGRPVEDWNWDGAQIHIPLPEPLTPGGSLELSIAYQLQLPSPQPSAETRPVPFGYTARQANLVDWYPFVPPYVPGEGWLAHRPGYFGEHLAFDLADFEVALRLENAPAGSTVAASAPAEPGEPEGVYRYRHPAARNFALSISDQYETLTETVDGVTVTGYHFPYHAGAGERVLRTTVEALRLYNELFGAYPRQALSVVEADFLDGMEYDGLYFLSHGFYNLYTGGDGEYLVAIAAHETAHQWWYASVANDQAMEPWLDEALSTYSERLYFERYYPEVLDWWWAYRIHYYEPRGWVDGSIYNPEGYRAYRDAVYLNGAVFLEELRMLTGDEAFLAFLKDYAAQSAGRFAHGEDFFRILGDHTEQDLEGLRQRFFQNAP